jgi:hypothetical protein
VLPGAAGRLDEQRETFGALLKVELAVLAAERAAAGRGPNVVAAAPNRAPARRAHRRRRRHAAQREAV